ncbi:pyridoxamine 5'-phosphate oxidase family protein [Streptomyces sp. NBC_00210]|uniref:pyridoxamine 5'-phosphate oxidase family protein n=1 Tax=unclassified Streptomyces TaxID=2593676 RepID=UPI0032505A66
MTSCLRPGARMVELSREAALELLGRVPLGRVAFSYQALPAIRLVNHVVDAGSVVIRTHTGSALLSTARVSEVVAYEADQLDFDTRTGWSVVVTGTATHVSDPVELARYRALAHPMGGHRDGACDPYPGRDRHRLPPGTGDTVIGHCRVSEVEALGDRAFGPVPSSELAAADRTVPDRDRQLRLGHRRAPLAQMCPGQSGQCHRPGRYVPGRQLPAPG